MYFIIEGICNRPNDDCDWVVEANSIEEAIAMLYPDETYQRIREISLEERIKYEEKEIRRSVEREYVNHLNDGTMTVREYATIQKELKKDSELYYQALVYYNKANRLSKRLARRKEFGSLTMAEYNEILKKLIKAKTEEEFNAILHSVDKRD